MGVRMAAERVVGQRGPSEESRHAEQAFEWDYRRNYPVAIRYARRMLEDHEEANDVVQTVFMRLLVAVRRDPANVLPADPREAQALIITAVHNEVMTLRRAKLRLAKCVKALAPGFDSVQRGWMNPERLRHQRQLSAIAWRATQTMPKRCREIFILVYYRGMSYSDAAVALGVARGTVHAQVKKATRIVRACLLPYKPIDDQEWAPVVTSRRRGEDDDGRGDD
jgi:RNA polymerase sigma-70 factor (ECF subfamily)